MRERCGGDMSGKKRWRRRKKKSEGRKGVEGGIAGDGGQNHRRNLKGAVGDSSTRRCRGANLGRG